MTSMTRQTAEQRLRVAVEAVERAQQQLTAAGIDARQAGCEWQKIAEITGFSRQLAARRFGGKRPDDDQPRLLIA